MPTRSEDFAGLSVAMITPFRDGQVDIEALQRQVEFQIEAGTTCVCPVGTTGECPRSRIPEHERVISAVVEAAAGRIKVMAGTGSNSTDEALRADPLGRQGRGRRRADRRPLLQQAHPGGLLSALQGPGPGGRHPHLRLQHPRPDRQEHRAGNHHPHGRAAQHHHGQGGDRLAGSGLADHRRHRPDRPQRRRQPDAAADVDRRPRRGLGGGQHRAART